MKDNTFMLEKGLREKIRVYFDKDLDSARMALEEQYKKYDEYKSALNNFMKADVKEDIAEIDSRMKTRVAKYKVFDPKKALAQQEKDEKNGGNSKSNGIFEKYGMDADDMVAEMERLRESEKEAREEVTMMQ
jgi:hypothetical protein